MSRVGPMTTSRRSRDRTQRVLQSTTLRDFNRGLNYANTDLAMPPQYAAEMTNMYRSKSGAVSARPGTFLIAIAPQIDEFLNLHDFNGTIIGVGKNGKVIAIDQDNNVFTLWRGTQEPIPWSFDLEFVSFAQFSNELIICNGVDKPLLVQGDLTTGYLVDKASGSNVNTPIARYVTSSDRYVVMSGDVANPSTLFVSNIDSSGTWKGDPAPNDAVNVDLSRYVHIGSTVIQGMVPYREKLMVFFERVVLAMQLGEYDSNGNHTPKVQDVIAQFGAVSHRSIQTVGDDILYADVAGIPSMKKSVFQERFEPSRESEEISTPVQTHLAKLSFVTQQNRVFSLFNRIDNQYMLFMPDNDQEYGTKEYIAYVYTTLETIGVKAWSVYRTWRFRCGATTQAGRVVLAQDNEVYGLGFEDEEVPADLVGSADTFSDQTAFTDATGWTVETAIIYAFTDGTNFTDGTYWVDQDTGNYEVPLIETGVPIRIVWETPWLGLGNRGNIKQLKYMGVDAVGAGEFDVSVYVDNDHPGRKLIPGGIGIEQFYAGESEPPPNAKLTFVGRGIEGFGEDRFGTGSFGASIATADERPAYMPTRFKIMKLRVSGYTKRPLGIVAFTPHYVLGSMRR